MKTIFDTTNSIYWCIEIEYNLVVTHENNI